MFADISNVLRIRDALWRHKVLGSASIMVGAGFSRNAEPVSAAARGMPAWAQLAGALCQPLYPHDDARRASALKEAGGTSGFLRIAQEYQVAFGVSDLNNRIRTLVPDGDYRPGDLHRRLLRLPWADVFSTNWDTLLERACADVFERSYDVVRTTGEIPFTSRPRIVKLHGSFPGHDPFIFTEEDYRTYPRLFAPFVNLVQQAMMETIFCLVGFSGDDPNFLHWSGWVRDNLGPGAPRIYLVGWLELSVHRRRMLEARNVMPIDLSGLPQAAGWPEHLRHRYAAEWFIAALELGKPYGPSTWPSRLNDPPNPPPYLGSLPQRSGPEVVSEPSPLDFARATPQQRAEQLRAVYRAWAHNRALYPGWVVAPEAVRERLWRTISELLHLFWEVEELAPWERLMALGELAWRFDTTLVPFVSRLEDSAFSVCESIDFVKREVGGVPLPDHERWSDVMACAERLARALARNGRHELDEIKFNRAVRFLDQLAEHLPIAREVATYERCQWLLATGDLANLAARVDDWSPPEGEDLFNLRKAGLLAELDDQGRACTLLEATLQRVRRNRRREFDDIVSLSLEAWALILALAYVDRGGMMRTTFAGEVPEPFERWKDLSVVDCNAFGDWSSLRRSVEESAPPPPSVERVRGFDLNRASITRRFTSGPQKSLLAGYRVMMLAEFTGLPPSAQHHELLGGGLKAAAKVLADIEPGLACQTVIRLQTTGEPLDAVFSRVQVARLPVPLVQTLKAAAMRRLVFGLARIGAPGRDRSGAMDILRPAFEVLSRLAVRLSPTDLQTLLTDTLEHYARVEVRRQSMLIGRELGNLLSRVLESSPPANIDPVLPELFALPLPAESGGPADHLSASDPVSHLPARYAPKLGAGTSRDEGWTSIVARLLVAGTSAIPLNRSAAIFRLFRLHQWGLLTPDETSAFADALWNPAHRDDSGLPSNTGLLPWVLLILPETTAGQAERALARYAVELSQNTRESVYARLEQVGGILQAFKRERGQVDLTGEDLEAFRRMVLEWTDQRAPPASERRDLFDRSDPSEAVAADCAAIILRFAPLNEDDAGRLWSKAEEMDEGRDGAYLATPLYAALATALPDRTGELLDRLRRALVSDDEDIARQGVVGVDRWLQGASQAPEELLTALDNAVREIGIAIASRRTAILPSALDFAGWLFTSGPIRYRHLVVGDCDHGLSALLSEASYERVGQPFDVPRVRAAAAALARAMTQVGLGDRKGVAAWVAAAADDPLPEVRNTAVRETVGRS